MKQNAIAWTAASIAAPALGLLVPALAMAQTPPSETNTLSDLARLAVYYFNIAIELIISLAIIVFVWNIYRYFVAEKDKDNKGERGMYLLWSVIGFLVIISFWGLVNLLAYTFNFNTAAPSNFYDLYSASVSGGTAGAGLGSVPPVIMGSSASGAGTGDASPVVTGNSADGAGAGDVPPATASDDGDSSAGFSGGGGSFGGAGAGGSF